MASSIAIVIPARLASTRFPGKPLCDLEGKPMIQWVYEAALSCGIADRVIVATPDQEILDACGGFQGEGVLTGSHHLSGTDRLAEVATVVEADIFLNVQGDEPLIDPGTIRACAVPLVEDGAIEMSSAFAPCSIVEEGQASVVKVVTDLDGFALYFSRHAVPFPRNARVGGVKKHVGIYGFRLDVLLRFAEWEPTPLEMTESLEQLRFLEHGVRIKMAAVVGSGLAVDTPEQADAVRAEIRARLGGFRES